MAFSKYLTDKLSLTYQTRLTLSDQTESALSDIACLTSSIERSLYSQHRSGRTLVSMKNETVAKYQIPARYFNSIKSSLEGKIEAIKSQLKNTDSAYSSRIQSQIKKIKKSQSKQAKATCSKERSELGMGLRQSKQRLERLVSRHAKLKERIKKDDPELCFGSKVLFNKQHHLEANNYQTHADWLGDWRSARSSQFLVVGSKDESNGCQICGMTKAEDGSLTARLRVPDTLSGAHGKYLTIKGIRFAYGMDNVLAALASNGRRSVLESKASQVQFGDLYKTYGQALTFRFCRDDKGWRLLLTTKAVRPKTLSAPEAGILGMDLNADHLAIALIDRHGNPVNKWTVPCHTYGKSADQCAAAIGEACKEVVGVAEKAGVPIVIENLSFKKKKAELTSSKNRRYARMLSSLAYEKIKQQLVSRAYRHGVDVHAVNPAHTSTIGRTKFCRKYGLSVHHGAAVAIARRFYSHSEKLPRSRTIMVWDDKAGSIPLMRPEDRNKHVWSRWGVLRKSLLAAHAAPLKWSKHPPSLSNSAELSAWPVDTSQPF